MEVERTIMAEFIDMVEQYKIQKGSRGYIVSNVNGTYENHGHFQKLSTCYVIIRLISQRLIPRSPYLIEAAKRITTDDKYRQKLSHKQSKSKPLYFNSSKGVRR